MTNKEYYRPWGSYTILRESENYWVKLITVNPGQKLSLQYHNNRSEKWTVIFGRGYACINGKEKYVKQESTLQIKKGIQHRMSNSGNVPLLFIEIAFGDELSEQDIIRIQDDYGRV